jgi:hypothetical protein
MVKPPHAVVSRAASAHYRRPNGRKLRSPARASNAILSKCHMSPIDLRLRFDHGARVAVQKNSLRQGWFADRFVLRLSQHRSKSVLPRPVPIETGLPDRALVRSQDPRRPFSGQKRCRDRRARNSLMRAPSQAHSGCEQLRDGIVPRLNRRRRCVKRGKQNSLLFGASIIPEHFELISVTAVAHDLGSRAESPVLDPRKPRRERDGLSAGGRWIRTFGSPTDSLQFSRKQSRPP